MAVTEIRKKQVDFSDTFLQDKIAFIYKKKSKLKISKKGLKGKVIGLQSGTIFEKYLNKGFKNIIKLKNYSCLDNAFLDIKNGRIDAYVGDDSVLRCWNKSNKNSIYEVATVENKEFISNIAIAVKKGNHQLLKKSMMD